MQFENLNENTAMEEDDALWSIEDDTLFQPFGLISHSSSSYNKTKSVFVTWNEYYLINYRFKKSKKTNRMEMTMVRIPLPNNSHLRSIHMLEYNTLLLMSDGRVHCFGSIKSLHNIFWLKGVRAFARAQHGFSVILHNEETKQLLLQVYMDLPSLGKGDSTLQQSYDITYDDQNLFQSNWQNDNYTLLSVIVSQQHEKFMQCIFGTAALKNKQLHIFSIAGHVFVLIPQDENAEGESEQAYNIELLCVYATSVHFMRLLPAQNLYLVYLSCGSVDIWYVSEFLAIKQRQMHYTCGEWLDYDASSNNGDFYYTDGEQLVRLRFQYDAQLDDCVVHRCVKSVSGMQACAWVQHIEQLVCLSENNIFYRIDFSLDSWAARANESIGMISDLTPSAIRRLRDSVQIVERCEQEPSKLLADIEREHEKQQLVAVARNEAWLENCIEATLEFRRHLAIYGVDVLLLHTARSSQVELDDCAIYAILELKFLNIHLSIHSSHWQLLVYHGNEAIVYRVQTDLLLSKKSLIVIPLRKVLNMRLPEFTLKFVTFLDLQAQINAVLLPAVVQKNHETYRALFSGKLHCLHLYNKRQAINILTQSIEKQLKPTMQQNIREFSGLNVEQIADKCNASKMSYDKKLELYFLDSKLTIASVENNQNHLTLQSEDVSALYHIKQHLFLNMEPDDENIAQVHGVGLKVMKLQHNIERFYSSQNTVNFEDSSQIHLESLFLKYNTLRSTIF